MTEIPQHHSTTFHYPNALGAHTFVQCSIHLNGIFHRIDTQHFLNMQ